MISTKYDAPVWVLIGLAAVAMVFCAGCRSDYQWRAAAASTRIEYGGGTGELDRGKRDWDTRGTWLAVSIQPLAYLDMDLRAERYARAATEAAYAAVPPPTPAEKPTVCPHTQGSR